MTPLSWVLTVIGAFFVGVYLFSPWRPGTRRSIVIKAPPERVFPHINNFQNWRAWSPWYASEPTMELRFSGPESGEGAVMEWSAETQENGVQTIVESVPHERIETRLDFKSRGNAVSRWQFRRTEEDHTELTWQFEMSTGLGPVGRLTSLVVRNSMEPEYEKGLQNLKRVVESAESYRQQKIAS